MDKQNMVDKWTNKIWCVYTVESDSALKKKEILSHATTWINLEDIMLSEIIQSQKNTWCMIPLL